MNAQFDKHRAATEGLGVSLPSTIPEPPLEYYLGSKLETLNVIGTGGMGTVLEVYHRELGVKRAVKLIDNALMQRSEQVFMRF
ncbi:MAG: hypothetical protein JXX29_08945, partial [Deltaproteobacteria bacterium]|nr:hypothetical protein [Deltaproteobacteria bacterium]